MITDNKNTYKTLVYLILTAGLFVTFSMSVFSIFVDNYALMIFSVIFALCFLSSLVFLTFSNNAHMSANLAAVFWGLLLLYSYFSNHDSHHAIIWFNLVPIVSYVLFPRKKALLSCIVFIALFIFLFLLQNLSLLKGSYETGSTIMLAFNLSIVMTIAYFYKKRSDIIQQNLNKKITALANLSGQLQEEYIHESELQKSLTNVNRFIENIINNSPNLIVVRDKENRIILSNRKFKEMVRQIKDLNPDKWDEYNKQCHKDDLKVLKQGEILTVENEITLGSDRHTFLTQKVPIKNNQGELYAVCSISTDITEQKQNEAEINRQKELLAEYADDLIKFKLAVANAHSHIIITDPDGIVIFANKAVKRITGYSNPEVVGAKSNLWGKQMSPEFYAQLWETIKSRKETFQGEILNKRKNGELYLADISISPIFDDKGEIKYFIGMERDISQEKEIEKMKTEFTTLISHQLRTPLTSVKWNAELLIEGDENNKLSEDQSEMILGIRKSTDRLISMVNTLVNISKIEAGTLRLTVNNNNYVKLIREVITEIKPDVEEAGLTLDTALPEDLVNFNFDYNMIKLVLMSIINNAIRYNSPSGMINLAVYVENGDIVTMIRDTGTGIPAEAHEKIFSKFYRADNALRKVTDGSGLSLSLVKSILDAAGGKIWFESKVGVGTAFYFSLPYLPSNQNEL